MYTNFHSNKNTTSKALITASLIGSLFATGCQVKQQNPVEESQTILDEQAPILEVSASASTSSETGVAIWRMHENPADDLGRPTGGMYVGLDAQGQIIYSAMVEISYRDDRLTVSTWSPFEDGHRVEELDETNELVIVEDTLSSHFQRMSELLKFDIEKDYQALVKERAGFWSDCENALFGVAAGCGTTIGSLLVLVGSLATATFTAGGTIIIAAGSLVVAVGSGFWCAQAVDTACDYCGWSCYL